MNARVLLVNNASAEPFRLVVPPFAAQIIEEPPAIAWRQAAAGRVDLALLPVIKIASTAATMEPIGEFGVACTGPVGSVLLLSSRSLEDLARCHCKIYMTPDSETSRRLLQLLAKLEFGISFSSTPTAARADAQLLIGDTALRARQDRQRWPFRTDLCQWWHLRTQLPFVFARWMIRRSSSETLRSAAHQWLSDCVSSAKTLDGRARMVKRTIRDGLFGNESEASAYYAALTSDPGLPEREGEQLFLRLSAANGNCAEQSGT